jgi:hypothetical protein
MIALRCDRPHSPHLRSLIFATHKPSEATLDWAGRRRDNGANQRLLGTQTQHERCSSVRCIAFMLALGRSAYSTDPRTGKQDRSPPPRHRLSQPSPPDRSPPLTQPSPLTQYLLDDTAEIALGRSAYSTDPRIGKQDRSPPRRHRLSQSFATRSIDSTHLTFASHSTALG